MGRIVGIIAIQNYLGKSESTIMDMINHQDLPAEKNEGVWEVDQAALDRWRNPVPQKKRKAARSKKTESKKSEKGGK